MIFRGSMDGWNGDENECNGYCGKCEKCDERFYQLCDEEYEDLFNE